MHESYGTDEVAFWSNGIYAIVSLLSCATLLFLICAKKLHKGPSSTIPCNQEGGELEPSVYPRTSTTYKDILINPKKTDLIRLGKLKADKKDPNYDTMVDIDRELSLEKMDESQKSDETHIYETLIFPVIRKTITPKMEVLVTPIKQTPSKPKVPPTPLPRRDSDPQPFASNLPSKIVFEDPPQQAPIIFDNEADQFKMTLLPQTTKRSKTDVVFENEQRAPTNRESNPQPPAPASNLPNKMHTASKTKIVLEDPTQQVSFISFDEAERFEATGPAQTTKRSKNDVAGNDQRGSSLAMAKVSSKELAGKPLKTTQSSGGANVWDKTKSPVPIKNNGTQIAHSPEYVKS